MKLIDLHNTKLLKHSLNVSRIAGMLARKAGYKKHQAKIIEEATLFHDIGKNHIPDSILDKPDKLTPDELAIVKNHTAIAHKEISSLVKTLEAADIIAKYHHERLDGTGYYGLAGNEIPEFARLVAIADVLDALLSERPYKSAWSLERTLSYMKANAGTQFDKRYVDLLLQISAEIGNLYEKKE